jgi:hypothetical protein
MRIGIDARMYGKNQSGIGTYIKNITDNVFELDNVNDYYIFLLENEFENFNIPNERVHKIKTNAH